MNVVTKFKDRLNERRIAKAYNDLLDARGEVDQRHAVERLKYFIAQRSPERVAEMEQKMNRSTRSV